MPVFSITNDCNLNCPICFTYNRPDKKYYKTVEETKRIIGHIVAKSGGVQLINLTGGEPTLHPELFAILDACRSEGIGNSRTKKWRLLRSHGLNRKENNR